MPKIKRRRWRWRCWSERVREKRREARMCPWMIHKKKNKRESQNNETKFVWTAGDVLLRCKYAVWMEKLFWHHISCANDLNLLSLSHLFLFLFLCNGSKCLINECHLAPSLLIDIASRFATLISMSVDIKQTVRETKCSWQHQQLFSSANWIEKINKIKKNTTSWRTWNAVINRCEIIDEPRGDQSYVKYSD